MHHGQILAEGSPTELMERHAGRETLEVHGDAAERQRIQQVLAADAKGSVAVQVEDGLFIFCADVSSIRERLALERQFIQRPATLEDVFLRLTGGKLQEGASG